MVLLIGITTVTTIAS